MARRPSKRIPKILHGLDMSAIIEVSDDENDADDINQPTPPATTRSSRTTRQRINGEAPALYSAKYHPMDDVMRPAAAKRYHGEAFEREEDTDDPAECMTDVGSIDEDNVQPIRRKWSTGIRHSGRLDAPSRKLVDYNMKRHPQDAQLRLLEKSSPDKRAKSASFTYVVHQPELLEGDGESSDQEEEEEEKDDDELPSVGEAPIPTKRVSNSVQHSSGRRSVQVVIDDSDNESSSSTDDGDADKENNTPTTRMEDVGSADGDDNIDAANHYDANQMVDMEDSPPPPDILDAETDSEDDESSSKAEDARPSPPNQMAERENRLSPSPNHMMEAETDTDDDEPSSKADEDSPTTQGQMVAKVTAPPVAHTVDTEIGAEHDETGSSSKADNVTASTQSIDHHMTDEAEEDVTDPRSIPDVTPIQTSNKQKDGEADLDPSTLRSCLDSVAVTAQGNGSQMLKSAEKVTSTSNWLLNATSVQPIDQETSSKDEARLLGSPFPIAYSPSGPSSNIDDDILSALLDVTDKVITGTQQGKVFNLIGANKTQAASIRVSVSRLPPPTTEKEALFAQPAASQLTIPRSTQVERIASPPNPIVRTAPSPSSATGAVSTPFSFARTASTTSPFLRAAPTPNPFVTAGTAPSAFTRTASTPNPFARTAFTPSPFVSSTAHVNQSSVPGQLGPLREPVRGLFTPSHVSPAGTGSGSNLTFSGGARLPTAPLGTGAGADNASTVASDTSSRANAFDPTLHFQTAPALSPTNRLFIVTHTSSLVFGAPSVPHVDRTPAATDTPETEEAGDTTEEEDEEDESDSDSSDDTYPRYPMSELVRDRIRGSRRRSPSSRSSSIRSNNYPHGNPDLEPELPAIPAVNSGASSAAPRLNPLGLATKTEPDGILRRLPPGFDRYGSGASSGAGVLPAPPLPPRMPTSSSFSAGQALSSPIAEIPRGARGISRPRGAPPPRRIAGSGPIFVLPDAPFSSSGRHLDGEDYESPEEGEEYDKENWDY